MYTHILRKWKFFVFILKIARNVVCLKAEFPNKSKNVIWNHWADPIKKKKEKKQQKQPFHSNTKWVWIGKQAQTGDSLISYCFRMVDF